MMNNHEIINYYKQGNSLAAVERKYGISPYKFKKILKQENIHVRSRHEQCILENQRRGYAINHDYFNELDNTKAYWLGLLAADGTIRKDRNAIKIGLKAEDEYILVQLKNCLQSKAPIKHYTVNNRFPVAEFEFSSKQIKETLKYYSIVPNKTYIGVTMKDIPDHYKLAFIKGFFDGDGSFTAGKVKIVSKTKGILKEMQDFLPQKTHLYHTNKDLYSLEMSIIPSRDFLETIYQLETPCLIRKYNHYKESY